MLIFVGVVLLRNLILTKTTQTYLKVQENIARLCFCKQNTNVVDCTFSVNKWSKFNSKNAKKQRKN